MFDIAFISYNEPNADENFDKLVARFPFAKRIHGVKGIHNAHILAAKKCFTQMFWVVDGDSEILDSFNFADPNGLWDQSVYVYQAKNPVNGLTYGNGGVKLLPRVATLNMNTASIDMTTSIADHFTAVTQVASVTRFNVDPFSTWRSAFRECVKLSSKVIRGQLDSETSLRLDTWCTLVDDVPYGFYAYLGALAGRAYGEKNAADQAALSKVNDFKWLQELFEAQKFL
jgi:hypothetical protein